MKYYNKVSLVSVLLSLFEVFTLSAIIRFITNWHKKRQARRAETA